MRGHYRRITPNRLTELQNNPESIVTFLFPGDEADEAPESDWRYLNIDKIWHGLHFLLTGSALPNDPPLTNVVMGGTPLGDPENPDFDFGPAHFLSPQEVQEVAKELSEISKTDLEARFNPSALLTADVCLSTYMARGGGSTKVYNRLLHLSGRVLSRSSQVW